MPDNTAPAKKAGTAAKFWRYVGEIVRVYAHIPVTVKHGDVIAHPGPPSADGHWEEHPGPATREADNATTTQSAQE